MLLLVYFPQIWPLASQTKWWLSTKYTVKTEEYLDNRSHTHSGQLSDCSQRPGASSTVCFVPLRPAGVALAAGPAARGAIVRAAFATGAGFSNQYRSIGEEGGPDYWTKLGVEKKKNRSLQLLELQ